MSTHQMSQYRRTQQYATVESLLPENNVQAVQVLQSQEKLARVEPSGSYTQKHSGGQAENRNTSLAWLLLNRLLKRRQKRDGQGALVRSCQVVQLRYDPCVLKYCNKAHAYIHRNTYYQRFVLPNAPSWSNFDKQIPPIHEHMVCEWLS